MDNVSWVPYLYWNIETTKIWALIVEVNMSGLYCFLVFSNYNVLTTRESLIEGAKQKHTQREGLYALRIRCRGVGHSWTKSCYYILLSLTVKDNDLIEYVKCPQSTSWRNFRLSSSSSNILLS